MVADAVGSLFQAAVVFLDGLGRYRAGYLTVQSTRIRFLGDTISILFQSICV